MSLVKLSFINFKASLKNYISLIASLAFTVLIIFNFFNLMASPIMESLGQMNSRNLKIVIQCVLIVLSCFMFFFVWYATNVFLTKRKKEIGIYIFMGLTNQRIGKLYMLETLMIGLVSLIMGIGFGILVSQLFTMILITISDIEVQLTFQVSLSAVLWSCILYLIVYFIFVFKGYVNLMRSSVLDMVSANRQNEYIKQNKIILFLKALLGIIILVLGYYFAIKKGGMETISNSLLAVVLVIVGVYLLFGGFVPLTYQSLASHKTFLYRYQRTLWINQMIYRMKKNYRTYAIVTVLMICSVTALATGVAMYDRYQTIHDFENIARKVITDNGYDYNVTVEIGQCDFPTKEYGDVSLPAGIYDALRVKIGSASGRNWWCVMFPPLCFVDVSSGVVPDSSKELLQENLNEEEYTLITDSSENPNMDFKFKLVELFQNIKLKLANN